MASLLPRCLVIVLALEFQALATLGLATIRPAALLFLLLVPAQTRAQGNVNPRRSRETEALGHLDQIQLVYIEYRPERVRGVGLEVGPVAFLGRLD